MKHAGTASLIGAASAARALMAGVPNVEPITLAAMLAGLRYGPRAGFTVGFMSMLISDFYIGLPGPWTIYTTLAFGLVGFLAGFLPKAYAYDRKKLATSAGALTLVYQAIVNSMWPLMTGQSLLAATMMAIPFTAAQVLGNALIVPLFLPLAMAAMDAVPRCARHLGRQAWLTLTR